MEKPNFKDVKKLVKAINDTDNAFTRIFLERTTQEDVIKNISGLMAADKAREALGDYSVEELKNAKVGIRVSALQSSGFNTLGDLAICKDYELSAVEGIGEKQIEAIKNILTEFANSLSSGVTIKIDTESNDEKAVKSRELVTALTRYINCEKVRRDCEAAVENLHSFSVKAQTAPIIRNSVHWIFSGSDKKKYTLEVVDEIYEFCSSSFFDRLLNLINVYDAALKTSESQALITYKENSADYYALLEKLGSFSGHKPFIYDSIPAQLADDISSMELNLGGFKGNLRAYQAFGARYILHQGKVLLGDEMGLGKTIQAIAAMTHINETEKGAHFLIVCPASVLINWTREIGKFSSISTYILHGQGIEDAFEAWREHGGAAITNYESMGKIVDDIDNHMKLAMLVIDEAHYIKNPDAKRTQYIRRLDNESERILLMTGTPLENKVEEMCNLIDFARPDMSKDVQAVAYLSHLPRFRETLSPVYLRRTRTQVLEELPPIDENQEWCSMTDVDRQEYVSAVMEKSFASMRRVSFLQDDLRKSAKAVRLLEICDEAREEGRKVVIFSFFRETVSKVSALLSNNCVGVITGNTSVEQRQLIVDSFGSSKDGSCLVCQIQAGGVGLNIQAASIVIFCEPQVKPSLTWQALSRVYRMGQVRNVLVYHLLCEGTVDDEMVQLLNEKEIQFESFAEESAISKAYDNMIDKDWIRGIIQKERQKYLPMVVD